MSSEIARKSLLMTLSGTMSTAQRIAPILPKLSGSHKARGYSTAEFNLRITYETIETNFAADVRNENRSKTAALAIGVRRHAQERAGCRYRVGHLVRRREHQQFSGDSRNGGAARSWASEFA